MMGLSCLTLIIAKDKFCIFDYYAHGNSSIWMEAIFYSNEGSEPIHIHAEKGDMECKYWILIEEAEISEAFAFNMSTTAKKEIIKIIHQHFNLIIDSWNEYFKK